jgi:hypothetical protein
MPEQAGTPTAGTKRAATPKPRLNAHRQPRLTNAKCWVSDSCNVARAGVVAWLYASWYSVRFGSIIATALVERRTAPADEFVAASVDAAAIRPAPGRTKDTGLATVAVPVTGRAQARRERGSRSKPAGKPINLTGARPTVQPVRIQRALRRRVVFGLVGRAFRFGVGVL